jgi:hypothetical protein
VSDTRKPIAAVLDPHQRFGEEPSVIVMCDDGSVWRLRYQFKLNESIGVYGYVERWYPVLPVPGTPAARPQLPSEEETR